MRMRSIFNSSNANTRVNVTPMIDVVMVLIVFYLLVGQLAIERKARIDLPRTSSGVEEHQDLDPIIIGITTDGTTRLNGEDIQLDRLAGEIEGMHTRDPHIPIRIRAHREASFGVVRPVFHQLRDAGVHSIELVTEQSR